MPSFRNAAFALLIAALAPLPAWALNAPACAGRDLADDPRLSPDYAAFADDLVNDEGLLWRIDKDGVAPSYLYGTIHSTQPDPVARAQAAAGRLAEARTVVTELGGPFDAAAKVAMSASLLRAAVATSEDTFAGALSGDEAARVEKYLAQRGYPKEMARHLSLWFLAIAASMPACEAEGEKAGLPEVDEWIAETAKARGLAVVGLETFQEQLAAIAATPPKLAAEMLLAMARRPDLEDDAYVTLLRLYGQEHPAEAIAVIDAVPDITPTDRQAQREFTRLLLVGRNEVMASRAAPYLAAGGAFIAVGALHLPGKSGLIERFRALGYRVVRVP